MVELKDISVTDMDAYKRQLIKEDKQLGIFVDDMVSLFASKEDAHQWFDTFEDAYFTAIDNTEWDED